MILEWAKQERDGYLQEEEDVEDALDDIAADPLLIIEWDSVALQAHIMLNPGQTQNALLATLVASGGYSPFSSVLSLIYYYRTRFANSVSILSFVSMDALDLAIGATLLAHPWVKHVAGRADFGRASTVRAVRGKEEISHCMAFFNVS